MQIELFDHHLDLRDKRILVSLSGGINSAAVLCYLASEYPKELLPSKIWIFYAHLTEHSPGTLTFVRALIAYAKKHFHVTWGFSRASVLEFFRKEGIIPHPTISPCSEHLKMMPIEQFMLDHDINLDLVGYVRSERRRIIRQQAKGATNKIYPISHLNDEDCFDLVKREIGWYPAIYEIKENGKRVFKHNNCLPCKNFSGNLHPDGSHSGDYSAVAKYYPVYFEQARKLAAELNSYWGRPSPYIDPEPCLFCEFETFTQE